MQQVKFAKLHPDAIVPDAMTEGAGADDLSTVEGGMIPARGSGVFGTGLAIELPHGYKLRILPRSGLGFKHDVVAFYGTIDEDFRGEIKIKLFNHGDKAFYVKPGIGLPSASY